MEFSSIFSLMVKTEEIPERLQEVGRTQADLARHLGLDPSSLTKTIKGSRQLKAREMTLIEAFFEEAENAPLSDARGRIDSRKRNGNASRKLPVYGYAAAGGDDRVAVNDGRIIDMIDAPPFWSGAGELIGVRVIGVSMEPRLFQGETVVAQLGLGPARGQDCLVEFNDGSALVKTYGSQRDGQIFCRQYNPAKEVRIEGSQVKAIHAVLWRR